MNPHLLRRESRRRAVLDAALELFDREGYPGVSMRAIAERVGLTVGALYRYFASKESVFDAIAEEGFSKLLKRVENLAPAPPLERLYAQGISYLDFAADEPRLYRIMFLTPETTPTIRKKERTDIGHRSFFTIVSLVEAAQAEGTVPSDVEAITVAHACWAAFHRGNGDDRDAAAGTQERNEGAGDPGERGRGPRPRRFTFGLAVALN